jgi:transposase InsO family protein
LYANADHEEQVRDHVEPRAIEAEQLTVNKETSTEMLPNIDLDNKMIKDIFKAIAKAYKKDHFFSKIWKEPSQFNKFMLHKSLLWTNNRMGNKVVCVPNGLMDGKSLRGVVIDSCHQTTGHSGLNRSMKYVQRWFWWPGMADDIEEFCKSCGRCQTTKTPRQKSPGWLHTMPIPSRPWESIGMDFTGPFVEVGGFDYVLLIVCRMTGMVHLIPTRMDATAKQVAEVYVKEVIQLHGIPESLVSDRDMKFTSQFWRELSKILGQRLLMSTAYHPQTDRSSERAIQVMSQMLQSVINDHQMNWVEQLPLIEFAMNSAENESTGTTPFEVNYGWLPCIIRGVEFGSTRPGIKQFTENISNVIDKTFDQLLTQRTRQAIKANR